MTVPGVGHALGLGRAVGESLWPEWFKAGHFDRFKEKQRTWNALFQQKPRHMPADKTRGPCDQSYALVHSAPTLCVPPRLSSSPTDPFGISWKNKKSIWLGFSFARSGSPISELAW